MAKICVCVCNSSLNGKGKTSRVTELMQMALAFISPCSILCGRHLHFPKVSCSLPVPQANPELQSRGKPFYKVRGGSPDLERGELTIFEKESSYFKVATLDTAELGSFPSPDRLRCAPLWGAGTGTIPKVLPGHRMWVTHRGGDRGAHTRL